MADLFRNLDHFCEVCQQLSKQLSQFDRVAVENLLASVRELRLLKLNCEQQKIEYQRLDGTLERLQSQHFGGTIQEMQDKFNRVENEFDQIEKLIGYREQYLNEFYRINNEFANIVRTINRLCDALRGSAQQQQQQQGPDLISEHLESQYRDVLEQLDALQQHPNSLPNLLTLQSFAACTVVIVDAINGMQQPYLLAAEVENAKTRVIGACGPQVEASIGRRVAVAEQDTRELSDAVQQLSSDIADIDSDNAARLSPSPPHEKQLANAHEHHSNIRRLSSIIEQKQAQLADLLRRAGGGAEQVAATPPNSFANRAALPRILDVRRSLMQISEQVKQIDVRLSAKLRQYEVLRTAQTGGQHRGSERIFIEERVSPSAPSSRPPAETAADEQLSPATRELLADCQNKLRQWQQWLQVAKERVDKIKASTIVNDADLIGDLKQLESEIAQKNAEDDQIAKGIDRLPHSKANNARLWFLELKTKLIDIGEEVNAIHKLVDKIVDFGQWLSEFEKTVRNASPDVESGHEDKWQAYNAVKWQHDYGQSREITIHTLEEGSKNYQALRPQIIDLLNRYRQLMQQIKLQCERLGKYAEAYELLDKQLKRLLEMFDHLQQDIDAAKHSADSSFKRLQDIRQHLKEIEQLRSSIGQVERLADQLQAPSPAGTATSSDAWHTVQQIKDRYSRLLQDCLQLERELDALYKAESVQIEAKDDNSRRLAQLRDRLDNACQLKATLQEKKHSIAQLKSINRELEQLEPNILPRSSNLETEFVALKRRAIREEANWNAYVREHEKFDTKLNEFQRVLKNLETAVEKLSVRLIPKSALEQLDHQATGNQVQELRKAAQQLNSEHWQLSDLARPLTAHTSKQGREDIREQLRSLRDEVHRVQKKLNQLAEEHRRQTDDIRLIDNLSPIRPSPQLSLSSRASGGHENESEQESGLGDSLTEADGKSVPSIPSMVSPRLPRIDETSRSNASSVENNYSNFVNDLTRMQNEIEQFLSKFGGELDLLAIRRGEKVEGLPAKVQKLNGLQNRDALIGDQLMNNFKTAANRDTKMVWPSIVNRLTSKWNEHKSRLNQLKSHINQLCQAGNKLNEFDWSALNSCLLEAENILKRRPERLSETESLIREMSSLESRVNALKDELQLAQDAQKQLQIAGINFKHLSDDLIARFLSTADRLAERKLKEQHGLADLLEMETALDQLRQRLGKNSLILSSLAMEDIKMLNPAQLQKRISKLEEMKVEGNKLLIEAAQKKDELAPPLDNRTQNNFDECFAIWREMHLKINNLIELATAELGGGATSPTAADSRPISSSMISKSDKSEEVYPTRPALPVTMTTSTTVIRPTSLTMSDEKRPKIVEVSTTVLPQAQEIVVPNGYLPHSSETRNLVDGKLMLPSRGGGNRQLVEKGIEYSKEFNYLPPLQTGDNTGVLCFKMEINEKRFEKTQEFTHSPVPPKKLDVIVSTPPIKQHKLPSCGHAKLEHIVPITRNVISQSSNYEAPLTNSGFFGPDLQMSRDDTRLPRKTRPDEYFDYSPRGKEHVVPIRVERNGGPAPKFRPFASAIDFRYSQPPTGSAYEPVERVLKPIPGDLSSSNLPSKDYEIETTFLPYSQPEIPQQRIVPIENIIFDQQHPQKKGLFDRVPVPWPRESIRRQSFDRVPRTRDRDKSAPPIIRRIQKSVGPDKASQQLIMTTTNVVRSATTDDVAKASAVPYQLNGDVLPYTSSDSELFMEGPYLPSESVSLREIPRSRTSSRIPSSEVEAASLREYPESRASSRASSFIILPASGEVMYEDRFVRLTPDELLIKTYYFPTLMAKRVHPTTISAVFWRHQGEEPADADQSPATTGWGCVKCSVWWALNFQRDSQDLNTDVIIDVDDERTYKAFSVRHAAEFLTALAPLIKPDAPILNRLP